MTLDVRYELLQWNCWQHKTVPPDVDLFVRVHINNTKTPIYRTAPRLAKLDATVKARVLEIGV
jgi:hypothetical protein